MVQTYYPPYEAARAEGRCKWCVHFQFGIGKSCLCTLQLRIRYKIARACRQFVFIDSVEHRARIELLKLRNRSNAAWYRYRHREEINAKNRVYMREYKARKRMDGLAHT